MTEMFFGSPGETVYDPRDCFVKALLRMFILTADGTRRGSKSLPSRLAGPNSGLYGTPRTKGFSLRRVGRR